MTDEKDPPRAPATIGDAIVNLTDWLGCLAIILIFGTCAGCFTVAGIHRLP